MSHPAVFLDRDDTLVVDHGFIDHPDKVALVPGAIDAVRRLRSAGYRVVVVTNQSGVARGYFDEDRLAEIHKRMQDLLQAGGARLDGIYHCPYLDSQEAVVERYRLASDLRKPQPGMLVKAARELNLDLSRSWMIGDAPRDIEAGRSAGCRTILVHANGHAATRDPDEGTPQESPVEPTHRARSLVEAVGIVVRASEEAIVLHDDPVIKADDDSVRLLGEIRDLLDHQRRDALHDDFSLWRLMATLVQMLALVVAGWGVAAMFTDQTTVALTRLGLAMFLQLVMISLILADRRK